MKAKIYKTGAKIDYTPGSDVDAGDVISIAGRCGVAESDIDSGDTDTLVIEGIVEVVKDDSDIDAGDDIWFDDDANPVGGTAGSGAASGTAADRFMGTAVADAGTTAATVKVLLNTVPNTLLAAIAAIPAADATDSATIYNDSGTLKVSSAP